MSLCLVTGGGSGIGLATAKQLAQKHDVIICGRNAKKLDHALASIQQNSTKKIYSHVVDVSQEAEVKALFAKIRAIQQPLVACVNNAGALFKTPFLTMQANILQETLAANLTSTFLCSQQACKLMKEKKNKRMYRQYQLSRWYSRAPKIPRHECLCRSKICRMRLN